MIEQIRGALSLAVAAREWLPLARSGNPVHSSVLARWADRGIEVAGRRVHLQTVRLGGQRLVTREAIEEFLAALNADEPHQAENDAADVSRRGREASRALEALGA